MPLPRFALPSCFIRVGLAFYARQRYSGAGGAYCQGRERDTRERGMSAEPLAGGTRPASVGLPGLRAAREAKFLTQIELAERAGINPSTISELEVGRRKARFRTIRQLAAALAVTPEELVTPPQERTG